MTIKELLGKYQFHDSMLENIQIFDNHSVVLVIDVCLWMQDSYQETDPETQIQRFVFDSVTLCEYDEYDIDSDTILEARTLDDQTLELTVLSDTDHTCHFVQICAGNVNVSV